MGGPHITAFPLEASRHATTVVIGEAENTWRVLLQDLASGQLKRYYVGGPFDTDSLQGSVHQDHEPPGLAGLPHLRRDLLPRKRYTFDSIFTTRGCPFGCSFCPVMFLNGTVVRHRPIEEVVAEVNELRPMYFNLDDSAFPAYDQPYYLDLYREPSGLRPKHRWMAFGSLNAINQPNGREVLKR
ncbi:B12-binding domain-containing radical SAM protein [Chloroflexota bacterium]